VTKVLIVCLGNQLVADDGIGQVLYQELSKKVLPEQVRLKFLGLGGIDLIDTLRGEDLLIVVDGVQLGGEIGDVVTLDWKDLPVCEGRPVSGHGIGVREAIAVARHLCPEQCPQRVTLVGIEGVCFDKLGIGLSQEVARSIPKALTQILDLAAS